MYHQLAEPERYTLSVLKREGHSFHSIAGLLQCSPSTIRRERRSKRTHGMEKRGKLANKPMIDARPEAVQGR